MVATPFDPTPEDHCRHSPIVEANVQRRNYFLQLHEDRIRNQLQQQTDTPDAVPIQIPVEAAAPPPYVAPPPPYDATPAGGSRNWPLVILLILLAATTTNVSQLQHLIAAGGRHADWADHLNLILVNISLLLIVIIGVAVIASCTYYEGRELPWLISISITVCAFLLPIVNIVTGIMMPRRAI